MGWSIAPGVLRDSGKRSNIDPAPGDSKQDRATAPLAALVVLVGALACGRSAERVLLVTVDTLRADHLGCYGADFAHTPRLDALAAGGVRFATAISPAPLTLVSHTTLMTGLDPPQHGVRHNGVFRLAEDVPTLAEGMGAAGFASAAFVAAYVLDRRFGLARGFERYDDRTSRAQSGRGILGYAERPANEVVDAALAWLDTAPQRFFLWVHLYDPHAEYQPPPGFASAFANRPYDGEIAFADAQLGRLFDALAARFPGDGTLVVVTADHGESLREHGEPTHSHTVYDATQHVPLLLRGPGLPAGRVVAEPVALRDVAPTILELAGAEGLGGAGGRSLARAARGGRSEPATAYVETLATQLDWGWSPLLGVRSAQWKYIRAPRPELYDLAGDPGETRNLAEAEPARAAELDAELERRLAGARPTVQSHDPGDEGRARLEALGYVFPTEIPSRGELGVVGGRDPKDEMETLAVVYDANRLLGEGKPTEALAKLLPIPRENVVYQGLLSATALAAGDAALAERAARTALRVAPLHRVGSMRLGQALVAQERWEEARATFAELLAREPDSGEPHTALGRISEWTGERERAAEHYRAGLAAERPDADSAWRLAALELEAGRPGEAAALLVDVRPARLEEPEVALRLARAELAARRPEQAVARLESALRTEPGSIELRVALAGALRLTPGAEEDARREGEGALALIDRGLASLDPAARTNLLRMRARALDGLGRRDEAARDARAAMERSAVLGPDARRELLALAAELGVAPPGDRPPPS